MAREIKIATFNVEWMVNLFKPGKPNLLVRAATGKKTNPGGRPKDPQGVADRIAAVIKAVDADVLGICEGPPLKAQLQRFVKDKLGDDYTVYSMPDGVQSVHALVHKRLNGAIKITQLPESDKVYERLSRARAFYKFGNVRDELKGRFTRLPVILRLDRRGKTTEIMIVHTKSKFSALKSPTQWTKKDRTAIIDAIYARQKLSVEMNIIRKYIAHRLHSRQVEAVIVLGDMNDGVTRDIIDENYLLHSIVHELRGAFQHELALMRHVLDGKQLQKKSYAWTVEFKDAAQGGKNTRVLLDHMIFSPACLDGGKVRFVKGSGRVEHAAFNAQITKRGNKRDERPSDHVPLSARFELV